MGADCSKRVRAIVAALPCLALAGSLACQPESANEGIVGHVKPIEPGEELTTGARFERFGEAPVSGGDVPAGRWFLAPAATPDDQEKLFRELETLGYVAGSKPPTANPTVPPYDAARTWPGINFHVSGHGRVALLTDLDGNVLHQWHVRREDGGGDFAAPYIFRARPFPNGDLLALLPGEALVKIDRDSKVLWRYEARVHHDFEVLEDGTIYVLNNRARILPRIDQERPVLEPFIEILSPHGRLLRRVSLLEAVERSPFASLYRNSPVRTGDVFHTNTLEVLDGRFADRAPWLKRGNVLTSFLVLDTIAVVDMETDTVVQAWMGSFRDQHDPKLLDNGNFLLFDNRGGGIASSVMEFDPVTGDMKWEYRGDEDDPFFTETCGTTQRFANGNTLITESDRGRAFEVDRRGEIVWEFFNPYRAGESQEFVAAILDMQRLPPDFPLDWARPPEGRSARQ